MASSKATETLTQTVSRFMSINLKTKFLIKRNYDGWAIKQIFADRKRRAYLNMLSLDVDSYASLGPDIAVSRFVLGRLGGQVRDHTGAWITRYRDLPKDFDESFKLTSVIASNACLITEGLDNFVGLHHLETLDLSKNPDLDNFSCDQLARRFLSSQSLTAIDISHNPLISVYGLETLLRIPSLRYIVATNTAASNYKDIDLFTIAAQDECDCQVLVHGDKRQYKLQELEDTRTISQIPRIGPD